MARRGFFLAGTVLLVAGCAAARPDAPARSPSADACVVLIRDRFEGPALDPVWDVAFTNPGTTAANTAGWEHRFASGSLVVSHIEPATLSGAWSYVALSRPLGGHVTDFSLSLSMGWKSAGASDMTNVVFTVHADDGSVLGQVLYHDAWTGSRGEWVAIPDYARNGFWPATKSPGWADYRSGPGTLGDVGSETLTIARTAGVVSLRIGEKEVLSYAAGKCASRAEIAFGYAYDPASTMGELRADGLDGTVTVFSSAASCDAVPAVRQVRVTAVPPIPAKAPDTRVLEERWFSDLDGTFEKEERVDIPGAAEDVLSFRYGPISDSGVELERAARGGAVLWRVHVQPLGIAHSKYHHEVKVRVDGDRIVVESVGAQRIVEVRELATGKQVSREVTDVR
jgi:hypothetical protein